MLQNTEKSKVVSFFVEKGILVGPNFINNLDENFNLDIFYSSLTQKISSEDFLVISSDLYNNISNNKSLLNLNWHELDKSKVLKEKEKDEKLYNKFMEYIDYDSVDKPNKAEDAPKPSKVNNVNIVSSYLKESKKREIQDFVKLFNNRFKKIEKMFYGRRELQNITSISRVKSKKEKEAVSFIGIVYDKQVTKNNNIMLTLEDSTSEIKVLINKSSNIYDLAKDIVFDEIIGVTGVFDKNLIFANNIIWPEFPLHNELKKSPDEAYAIFLSDIHVGSKNFQEKEFMKFIKWINGELGTDEHKKTVQLIKYIFIAGDLVDGIGIYPEQDRELSIKDIFLQYKECARLLSMIPSRISIIICPGNHDAMRLAEPQPELYKDFTKHLWELDNVIMVSNPSIVNIHASPDFSGFDVLLYHGYSFDYYVANVDSIRSKGGYDRADLIMKYLLQRRHLAPSHTSTLYIPDAEEDPLVIDKIPDFFVTGHIHKTSVSSYRNITLICGSCWQSKTSFQEKVGHHPEPCRVPIVNLHTREVKILKF